MSFIGFIKDENGNYYSADKKTRYRMLEGTKLVEFLESVKGQPRYFYIESDEEGNKYAFETDEERFLKMKSEKDHIRYKRCCEIDSGYQVISLNETCDCCETEMELIDNISYEDDESVETLAFSSLSKKRLRAALRKLTKEEYELIYWVYLAPNRISLKRYAELKKVPRRTMRDRKSKIFEKIKKLL